MTEPDGLGVESKKIMHNATATVTKRPLAAWKGTAPLH